MIWMSGMTEENVGVVTNMYDMEDVSVTVSVVVTEEFRWRGQ